MKRKFPPKLFFPFLFLLFGFAPFGFTANIGSDALSKADADFRNGKISDAKETYAKYITDNPGASSATLFYNYGTILMKSGEAGAAYAYLLKALNRNPVDMEIRNNLEFIRNQLSANAKNIRPAGVISSTPQEIFYFTEQTLLILTLASAGITLALYLYRRSNLVILTLFGILFVIFAGTTLSYSLLSGSGFGITITKEAKIHSGPSTNFPEIYNLEEGSFVRIEETRDSWFKISFKLKSEKNKELFGWVENKFLIAPL